MHRIYLCAEIVSMIENVCVTPRRVTAFERTRRLFPDSEFCNGRMPKINNTNVGEK